VRRIWGNHLQAAGIDQSDPLGKSMVGSFRIAGTKAKSRKPNGNRLGEPGRESRILCRNRSAAFEQDHAFGLALDNRCELGKGHDVVNATDLRRRVAARPVRPCRP